MVPRRAIPPGGLGGHRPRGHRAAGLPGPRAAALGPCDPRQPALGEPAHPPPARARSTARAQLLRAAGFPGGEGVACATPPAGRWSSPSRPPPATRSASQIATIVQEDLRRSAWPCSVVTLEFRALLDRLLQSRDYDAGVLGLGGGDADPAAEMNVWLSGGGTHLWNLGGAARPPGGRPRSTAS